MGYDLYIRPNSASSQMADATQQHQDSDSDLNHRLLEHLGATHADTENPEAASDDEASRYLVERPFGKMAVQPAPDGRPGLDCTLPEGLAEGDVRELVETILAAALAEDQAVYDPQVGRTVSQADLEVVIAEWKRFNRYRLQTVGSEPSDLLAGGALYPEYESPTRPSTIFWATVGLLFVLGFLLVRFCT